MRFLDFMKRGTALTAKGPTNAVGKRLSTRAHGQWEPWLQIELYLAALDEAGARTAFLREAPYPNGQRCDLKIVSDGTFNTWIELKVMLNDKPDSLVTRFIEDVEKIRKITLPPEDNTLAAIAWAPNVGKEFLDTLRKEMRSHDKGNCFYYIQRQGQIEGNRSIPLDSRVPLEPEDSIMAFWSLKCR